MGAARAYRGQIADNSRCLYRNQRYTHAPVDLNGKRRGAPKRRCGVGKAFVHRLDKDVGVVRPSLVFAAALENGVLLPAVRVMTCESVCERRLAAGHHVVQLVRRGERRRC